MRGGLKQRIFACGQLWIKQQEGDAGACMQKAAEIRKRITLPVLVFLLVLFLLNLFCVDLQRFEVGIKVQRSVYSANCSSADSLSSQNGFVAAGGHVNAVKKNELHSH